MELYNVDALKIVNIQQQKQILKQAKKYDQYDFIDILTDNEKKVLLGTRNTVL